MDITVKDVQAMSRAVNLLATLDREQFTKEQQQIITDAIRAVATAEEYRQKRAERNKEFLRKKRKEIPGYNYPKTQPSGRPTGRPRKTDKTEEGETK